MNAGCRRWLAFITVAEVAFRTNTREDFFRASESFTGCETGVTTRLSAEVAGEERSCSAAGTFKGWIIMGHSVQRYSLGGC